MEISITIASIIFAVLWVLFAGSSYNGTEIAGTNSNLIAFVVTSLIFIGIFFLLYFISSKSSKNSPENTSRPLVKWGGYICIIALWICLLINYLNENSIWPVDTSIIYIRQNIPAIAYIFIIALGFLIYEKIGLSVERKARFILAASLAIFIAIFAYVPNALYDCGGNIYHYDAYTHSIFNVLQGFPYSDVCLSIYGHHGILYYPLVKLLGGGTLGVAKAVAVVSGLTIFATELAIAKLVKNDKVYLLTAIALPSSFVMINLWGAYAQIAPHRLFFPALLICFVSYTKEKADKTSVYIAGWIICVFSIVWNTETGILGAVSFGCYYIFRRYVAEAGKFNLRFWASVAVNAIASLLSFGLAVGFVDICNLIMGGSPLDFSTFVYPLLSDEYMNGALIAVVPAGVGVYVFIMILFLAGGCAAFIRRGTQGLDSIIFFLSIFGMAQLTYYINRPAYINIAICAIEFITLLGIHADMLIDRPADKKSLPIRWAKSLQAVLFILALSTVAYTGAGIEIKMETSWNMDDLYEQSAQLLAEVPEDTIAFGQGLDVILGASGRVTNLGSIDYPDTIRDVENDYIQSVVEEKGSFLVEYGVLEHRLPNFDKENWTILNTYEICGRTIYYMVKN